LSHAGRDRARRATDGGGAGHAEEDLEAALDTYTATVKPWWLYRDYTSEHPSQRYNQGWAHPDPQYRPVDALLKDSNGKPTMEVRVCREEAREAPTGHVYASGRTKPPPPSSTPLPGRRVKQAPLDTPYVTKHKGEAIACDTREGLSMAADCGRGLERCNPNSGNGDTPAFQYPNHLPLGPDEPLDSAAQSALHWYPYWWSREAVHYLGYLFAEDRDFREVLTGKSTWVNGPLAQFYKTVQRGSCCGLEVTFGMHTETEPLFDPARVPGDLLPHDVDRWELVPDRGPHAAGILTMPMYLEKYASPRARATAIYNDFLCKSFSAGQADLTLSDEPDLTRRPGCQACHATLEPLAAYFARVEPASFVYLPESLFPVKAGTCKKDKAGKLNGACNALYDLAFYDDKGPTLRSAYASPAHANAGPLGAATDVTRLPEFASCAVQRVASSFLGRATTADDARLLQSLSQSFVRSGYRMRSLVRGVVLSDEYRRANDDRAEPPASVPGARE